jgi:hypothetical protein
VSDGDPYGERFRLHVRGSDRGPLFRGSYPFIGGDPESGMGLDSFFSGVGRNGPIPQMPTNRGN